MEFQQAQLFNYYLKKPNLLLLYSIHLWKVEELYSPLLLITLNLSNLDAFCYLHGFCMDKIQLIC